MYPNGIEQDRAKQRGAFVEVAGLQDHMEGRSRPTFFRGVATVVAKLFNAVQVSVVAFCFVFFVHAAAWGGGRGGDCCRAKREREGRRGRDEEVGRKREVGRSPEADGSCSPLSPFLTTSPT
jgi:hypothetical protein